MPELKEAYHGSCPGPLRVKHTIAISSNIRSVISTTTTSTRNRG